MATPIIRVDDTKLQSWLKREPERQAESLRLFQEEGSQLVMEEMRQQVPIRTGFLRESITATMTPQGFTVYPSAPYAKYVEEGTAPHTIFPVHARVLRFETEAGATIFTKHVMHPGFPGRWFVKWTAEAVRLRLAELYAWILGRIHS